MHVLKQLHPLAALAVVLVVTVTMSRGALQLAHPLWCEAAWFHGAHSLA